MVAFRWPRIALLLATVVVFCARGASAFEEKHDGGHGETAAAGAHGDGGGSSHGGGGPITWQSDLALFSLAVFVVLFLVLKRFAWKPISDGLEARERSVHQDVERAEQARRESERLLDEHRKKLDLVQDEVRAILEEARRDAASTAQGIVAKAEEESRALQQRSLREVERARDQALRDIAQQAADLVAAAAGRVVRTSLSGADHRRLIEESLAEFGRGAGH